MAQKASPTGRKFCEEMRLQNANASHGATPRAGEFPVVGSDVATKNDHFDGGKGSVHGD